MCENHPLECRRVHILDHYRMDPQEAYCGNCDVCFTKSEDTHIFLPVKIKHLIKLVLDTHIKDEGSFRTVTQLTESVVKILRNDDMVLKATFDLSKLHAKEGFGKSFNIPSRLFYSDSLCNLIVEKTIMFLILECVLEERYVKEKHHVYLQVSCGFSLSFLVSLTTYCACR